MALTICSIENSDILVIGMTNGLVIVSDLSLDDGELKWNPMKEIQLEEQSEINYLSYCDDLDAIFIGDGQANLFIVSNVSSTLQFEIKGSSEEATEEVIKEDN